MVKFNDPADNKPEELSDLQKEMEAVLSDPKVMTIYQELIGLQHAMQTGVLLDQAHGSNDGSPKHLRVGVNSAMIEISTVVQLLLHKKIITPLEWVTTLRDLMKLEVKRYEERLGTKLG